MINRAEFTKMAKKILRSKQGVRDTKIMHPTREWFVGLFVAVLIFSITIFWSINSYMKYQNTYITDTGEVTDEVVVYRESLVEAALLLYQEREASFSKLLGETSVQLIEPIEEDLIPAATSTPALLNEGESLATSSVETNTSEASETEDLEVPEIDPEPNQELDADTILSTEE